MPVTPDFPWRAGMRYRLTPSLPWLRYEGSEGSDACDDDGNPVTETPPNERSPRAEVDPEDGATVGALAMAVREAWSCPYAYAFALSTFAAGGQQSIQIGGSCSADPSHTGSLSMAPPSSPHGSPRGMRGRGG